jgi:hypothetical protein
MADLVAQLIGLGILLAGLWWGYRRWLAPHAAHLDTQGRGLVGLLILTFMGGLLGSPFWWLDLPQSFSWDLPPLASRMLASAGWSFAAVTFLALERPTFRRVRLVLLMLAIYLGPLVVAILLWHLDRFNFAAPITYAFFIIVLGMTIPAIWYLWRQPTIIPDQPQEAAHARPEVTAWLALIAVLTGLWGLALFATDNGPSAQVWVWPGDLLSSRLIGVMLLTIAVGAAYSLRSADLSHLMLTATAVYGLGLAIASLWNILGGRPIKFSYLLVFGLIFLISSALLWRERRAHQSASSVQAAT